MDRARYRSTRVVVVVVLLVVSIGAAGGLAVGQADSTPTPTEPTDNATTDEPATDAQNATSNASETPTPTPTPSSSTPTVTPTPEPDAGDRDDGGDDEDREAWLGEIGESGVYVVSATWDDGQLAEVVVENTAPRGVTVTITDASINLQKHETIAIPQDSTRIGPGRSRLEFREVTRPDNAAVTIGTSRGGLRGLSPGTGVGLFDRAAMWADVRGAALGALLFGTLGMLGGVWESVAKRRVNGVEVVDTEETHA